ncbi:MAG: cytochrome c [Methylococcaceae bacterium]|nr:cytochrome c [Methylococcaceae bacterium]
MNRNDPRVVSGILTLLLAHQPLSGAEPNAAAGSVKFETCAGCHSTPGYANAVPRFQVPKLGGQQSGYVMSDLKAYSVGDRKHPSMRGIAESLNEQDVQDIAAYLASLDLGANEDRFSGNAAFGKEKAVVCKACHGEDGNSSDENFPRLAGQYQSYLIKVLQDYQTGNRNNPMMAGMVKDLSGEDVEHISAYYASQAKGLRVVER